VLRHKVTKDSENKYFCRNAPLISVRCAAL